MKSHIDEVSAQCFECVYCIPHEGPIKEEMGFYVSCELGNSQSVFKINEFVCDLRESV